MIFSTLNLHLEALFAFIGYAKVRKSQETCVLKGSFTPDSLVSVFYVAIK